MTAKRTNKASTVPKLWAGKEPRVREFGAGEAAEILGVEVWQLRNLLDGPAYKLGLFDQLGTGRGSRRTFSREGLHRIATAMLLLSDGFRPAFVGRVLEHLDEAEFSRAFNSEGEEVSSRIVFRRTSKSEPEIKVESFRLDEPPKISDGGTVAPYYALDLGWIAGEVDKKIRVLESGGKKEKQS